MRDLKDVETGKAQEEPTAPRERLQEYTPSRSAWGRARDNWSWEEWGRRSEYEWLLVARGLNNLIWAAIGALLGTTVAGIPALFVDTTKYLFVLWQPLGAGVGALIGLGLSWALWTSARRKEGRPTNGTRRWERPSEKTGSPL
ncbi:MAG: hypothetical protein HYX82_01950 [Chloroflexi bacterium]|nr:hypothetical protein [Chloroflexota bacterium]